MRFTFWYISLPFSAKQQREMTKFKVSWRTRTHDGEFSFLSLNLNTALMDLAPGTSWEFQESEVSFLKDVFVGVAVAVA